MMKHPLRDTLGLLKEMIEKRTTIVIRIFFGPVELDGSDDLKEYVDDEDDVLYLDVLLPIQVDPTTLTVVHGVDEV